MEEGRKGKAHRKLPIPLPNFLVPKITASPHRLQADVDVGRAVHGRKLGPHGGAEGRVRSPGPGRVADGAAHALDAAGARVRRGGPAEQGADARQVRRREQAGAVVEGAQAGELVGGPRDLEPRGGGVGIVRNDNVVPRVDVRPVYAQRAQRPHDHGGVPVAVKDARGADDAVVDVAAVVEDGAAAGAAADEADLLLVGQPAPHEAEVRLDPGVLVPAEDDARVVDVQEQDGGVGVRVLQQKVLGREVQVRVVDVRRVDLDARAGEAGPGVP